MRAVLGKARDSQRNDTLDVEEFFVVETFEQFDLHPPFTHQARKHHEQLRVAIVILVLILAQ